MKNYDYYKPNRDTARTRNAFQNMMDYLSCKNACLVSDFINTESMCEFSYMNIIIKSKFCNIKACIEMSLSPQSTKSLAS